MMFTTKPTKITELLIPLRAQLAQAERTMESTTGDEQVAAARQWRSVKDEILTLDAMLRGAGDRRLIIDAEGICVL